MDVAQQRICGRNERVWHTQRMPCVAEMCGEQLCHSMAILWRTETRDVQAPQRIKRVGHTEAEVGVHDLEPS